MTRDDVIRMAREAGFRTGNITLSSGDPLPFVAPLSATTCIVELERFAALIEAAATEKANERANTSWALMCEKMVKAEREACETACELKRVSHEISAEDEIHNAAIDSCMSAIRDRKDTTE